MARRAIRNPLAGSVTVEPEDEMEEEDDVEVGMQETSVVEEEGNVNAAVEEEGREE